MARIYRGFCKNCTIFHNRRSKYCSKTCVIEFKKSTRKVKFCKTCNVSLTDESFSATFCHENCRNIARTISTKAIGIKSAEKKRAKMLEHWKDPVERKLRIVAANKPETIAKKIAAQSIAQQKPETRAKRKQAWIDNPELKINQRERMLNLLPGMISRRTSDFEKSFVEEFKSMNFEWNVRFGRYVVDFVNHDLKVIVEIKGQYWHADPRVFGDRPTILLKPQNKTVEELWIKDENREFIINNDLKYDVLCFWEYDLKVRNGRTWMFNVVKNYCSDIMVDRKFSTWTFYPC